ncbi:MAG: hypothetical protein GX680_04875 [Bacteroidales bacterium]|nr:hypothetical protein [Bacteroidales bacterium]
MKQKFWIFLTLIALVACGGKLKESDSTKQAETEIADFAYLTYYNQRYEYKVDYPDFLIPQEEAGSGDGRKFISDDGKSKMLVYRTFKMGEDGRQPTIREAFKQDLEVKNSFEKELLSTRYFIKGKIDEEKSFTQHTLLIDEKFYTIYFEYPNKDFYIFEDIAKRAVEAFEVGVTEEAFVAILTDFINDCWCDKNFNSLLMNDDAILKKYTDPKMPVRRYFAPGTIPILYSADYFDFGFDSYTDFDTKFDCKSGFSLQNIYDFMNIVEHEFENNEMFTFAYHKVDKIPDKVIVDDLGSFTTEPVETPYPNADMLTLYLPESNGNPRAFYFIETPNSWKLAFVDDTLFGA